MSRTSTKVCDFTAAIVGIVPIRSAILGSLELAANKPLVFNYLEIGEDGPRRSTAVTSVPRQKG
jgi:hypothetical protein